MIIISIFLIYTIWLHLFDVITLKIKILTVITYHNINSCINEVYWWSFSWCFKFFLNVFGILELCYHSNNRFFYLTFVKKPLKENTFWYQLMLVGILKMKLILASSSQEQLGRFDVSVNMIYFEWCLAHNKKLCTCEYLLFSDVFSVFVDLSTFFSCCSYYY